MGNELDGVIVRFPRADGSGVVHELPARICNHCEEPTGKLDLVILEVQELPEHVHPAAICPAERLEIGKGKIHAYIPTRKEDVTVPGLFSDTTNASGLRQITGDAANGYWTEKGSSGSPAFIDGGVQLAGILRLSELGGVHEAFLIPGTVISVFVKAAARDRHLAELSESKGIDPLQLKPLFEAVEREVPAEQFEPAIRAAVDTLLAKSRDKAQPMNDPLAVAEAINAARAKLAELDVEGALNVLQGEVENQESLRQSAAHSEVRLLLEIADIASKAYQWDRAVAALEKAAPLANDDYSIPVMAGDIHVHQGRLGDALAAFERALETAECSGDQRSVSVSQNRIGDVLRAKGNLAGALEAYKKGLVIAERLAISDASNSEWQRDLSVSHNKIGDVLVAQGDTSGALKAYRDSLAIRERLAASDASNSEWQRDLSVSHNKIGDVLVAQGDTSGALKAYRDSLAIRERLAASDASNSEWQRDLSVSHNKIGDVLVAQGDTSGALKAYR
ncbi:MAG: tetratricopeptide repeat protein, partial [Nitratireductor sp.]|nr:tetratricopeptide repeat protein [Nitratireductor sp.]